MTDGGIVYLETGFDYQQIRSLIKKGHKVGYNRCISNCRKTTKEYGLSAFIRYWCSDITKSLKEHFPIHWEWILVAMFCRLSHTSPLKNMGYYYRKSFLSEELNVSVTPSSISLMLKDIGKDRISVLNYSIDTLPALKQLFYCQSVFL